MAMTVFSLKDDGKLTLPIEADNVGKCLARVAQLDRAWVS